MQYSNLGYLGIMRHCKKKYSKHCKIKPNLWKCWHEQNCWKCCLLRGQLDDLPNMTWKAESYFCSPTARPWTVITHFAHYCFLNWYHWHVFFHENARHCESQLITNREPSEQRQQLDQCANKINPGQSKGQSTKTKA